MKKNKIIKLTEGQLHKIIYESLKNDDSKVLTLFHGSQHDFIKFQSKSIGTGEGSQSFGYGLYFTDNIDVAKSYAERLAKDVGYLYTVEVVKGNFIDWLAPIKDSLKEIIIEKAKEVGVTEMPIKKLLIKGKITTKYAPIEEAIKYFPNCKFLYENLVLLFGNDKKASNFLNEIGIDGITYPVGTVYKELKANGTNYVIFDENHVKVIDRKEIKKEISEKKNLLKENNLNPSVLYHGSPYYFKKFLMSKINTGQHSQDFGKGLYFTTDKETSEFYANALSNTESLLDKYKSCVKSFTDKDGILTDYLKRGMKMSVKRLVQQYINKNIGDKNEWMRFMDEIDKTKRYAYVYTVRIKNPNYISKEEYFEIQMKTSFDDDKMNSFLISKGYNGIIYEISMKNTSNKLTKEKNVVIFDENSIEIVNCEKLYFEGDMKLGL